ncbi:MAG: neutral/alkaline non-lysosomal ceramidase N-terminal domain-containing protein [Bacteroidales bacterium]
MNTKALTFFMALMVGSTSIILSQTSEDISVMAGAAKVNITPAADALPSGFNRIHDSLYTRAIVIDNGLTSAALVSIDNGFLNESIWETVTKGIEEETGIPVENIFLCPTHTHSAPMLMRPPSPSGGDRPEDPIIASYISAIEEAIIDVVIQAGSNLQPARIGYGTGISYLNVNRDVIDPETRLWSQGPNYDGVSDHTVAVVKIEAVTGEIIGVFINFAMHANLMYMSGAISAGMPGGVSSYIEDYYKNFHDIQMVALWSMGAAGDQNPVHFGPIMGGAARLQTDAAYARQSQMINSVGQLLGEEVIRVVPLIKRMHNDINIYGSQKTVTCPGRTRTDTDNREGKPGSYVDGDPVHIKLSLLLLGDIAFTGVNAEAYNLIAQRLKEESSQTKTIFTSITNGGANSGYIPSDDAFVRYTFQVLSSRLKPGCAENAIVNGLLDMMEEAK